MSDERTRPGSSLIGQLHLPTRRRDWRLVGRTVRLVLGIPAYAAVAMVGAAAALTLFVGGQNPALVGDLVLGGSLSLPNRLSILLELYPFVGTNYSAASGALLVIVALLIGIDVALLGYHLREHGLSAQEGAAGTAGAVLGALGAGCGACGAVLLTGVLSLVGATGVLTLLPLEGLELSLLASVVLILSIYWVSEGLRGGEIRGCPVDI